MKTIIHQLLSQKSLSDHDCERLLIELSNADIIQQAVVLTLLAAKQETFAEILQGRSYLLKQSTFPNALLNTLPPNRLDMVGTGGDGAGIFNVSTAASMLIASLGVDVTKHGGGSATSQAGSADVMDALHIPTSHSSEQIISSINQYHYAYIRGAYFNPVLKKFIDLRKHLGFPTIFNVLGPLCNPLQPKRQVIGVYRKDLLPIVAKVLQQTGSIHAFVIHAADGLDELSVSSPNDVIEVFPDELREYTINPEQFGFKPSSLKAVLGGNAQENATIIQHIFQNQLQGPKQDIVVFNAALGLIAADVVPTLKQGIDLALDGIVTGKANDLLEALQRGEP